MSKAKDIKNKKIVYCIIFLTILMSFSFIILKKSNFHCVFKTEKQNDQKQFQSKQEDNFIISCNQEDLIEDQKTISAEEAGEVF
jgi:hypothetical protein